ncbi:hypothetical protein F5Y18DRAFT_389987 [Xylariaceae sp. FL1019]|nr:hypothetical protein F5Y18DRAFT_389987 [Xylariaceae sp. FL1019]
MSASTLPRNTTLLDVPADIRRRIYHEAGLVHNCCLILSPSQIQDITGRSTMDASPSELLLTYNLLQVCKRINHEVGILICAQNSLVLVHEAIDYGLSFLRNLSPPQCAALRSVSIELHLHLPNMAYNRTPIESYSFENHLGRDEQINCDPLPLSTFRITSWLSAIRHVLSNTRGVLSLQLFCHGGYDNPINDVLQPFRKFPGSLRECELQLDSSIRANHAELRALAWEVASISKGLDPSLRSKPFRFFDLPPEIRQYILQFTDLVAPFNEIYWDSQRGFAITRPKHTCPDTSSCLGFPNSRVQNACKFLYCEGNSPQSTELPGCRSRTISQSRCTFHGFVCCQHRTGFSARCMCWTKPTALFLASRRLYHEAIQVLYSQNRVIIIPSERFSTPLGMCHKRLDVSVFITRHMWPEVLHHIRTLECMFPGVDFKNTKQDFSNLLDPYYLDFCFAMDHLQNNADTTRLTVIADITFTSSVSRANDTWFHEQLDQIKENPDLSSIFSAHMRLLRPFQKLRGKANFFVNLGWSCWPWAFSIPSDFACGVPRPQVSRVIEFSRVIEYWAKVHNIEKWLEAMIMGDGPDSKDRTKPEPTPSGLMYELRGKPNFTTWPGYRGYIFSCLLESRY